MWELEEPCTGAVFVALGPSNVFTGSPRINVPGLAHDLFMSALRSAAPVTNPALSGSGR